MSLIYLVRHGQASFGAADYDSLSEIGTRQCGILGEYFESTGIVFDKAYCGSMQRQTDTARIVMKNAAKCFSDLETRVMPEFDEHDSAAIIRSQLPGLLEDKPGLADEVGLFFKDKKAFQKIFSKIMLRWVSGERDVPGIDTYIDFCNRVREGYESVVAGVGEDEKGIVFTSGGVIASVIQAAFDLTDERAIRASWWIRNASVSVVRHSGKNMDVLSFNSTGHLESKNDPRLLTYK